LGAGCLAILPVWVVATTVSAASWAFTRIA